MKNIPMRFCGMNLHHNPEKLRIEDKGRFQRILPIVGEPDGVPLGRSLTQISGEGELYGADCLMQYRELLKLYVRQTPGLLMLPHMPAMYATLAEVTMLAQPEDDVLTVHFVFLEGENPRASSPARDSCYITTSQGESLWDIGYHTGVGIDELVRLNPQIRYIGSLPLGEKVRLC